MLAPAAASTQPRGVLPRVGGDGMLYRINDERIRSKFTISNVVPPHRYTLNHAELLVDDSGASNTELKLPARKAMQIGLQPFGHPSRCSRGSMNNICYHMNFNPPVLVKATFTRNGVVEFVENVLAVKCDKNEYCDALVAERAAPATLTENQQGDQYSTPHQESNTPVANLTNPGRHITEIHLTPATRHRPSDQPLQHAVIGIDGLKKLRLHLNCERQQLEIEEEEVLDDEEY